MSKDTLEFLKTKFIDDLREAEEDEHLPHLSLFKDIQSILINGQSECSPDSMEHCLNQLNIIFSDLVISLENRKIQRKKDPLLLGRCRLPDRTTRNKLLDIRKKLLGRKCMEMDQTCPQHATESEGIYQDPQEIDRQSKEIDRIVPEINRQCEEVEHMIAAASDHYEGIVREIGIVGLGGSGKTLLAKKIFSNHPNDYRIFFDLSKTREGKVDFRKILTDILKLYSNGSNKIMNDKYNSSEEALLGEVHKVLGSRKYLIVFDGIWNINLDWYFKLKDISKRNSEWKQEENGIIIIITTRFPGVAKRMVGSQNLYHMQPVSGEANWKLLVSAPVGDKGVHLPEHHGFLQRMKSQLEYKCDGLPFAGKELANIMAKYIIGEEFNFEKLPLLIINSKENPKLGKDLLTSRRGILQQFLVCDISETDSHQTFDDFYQVISTPRLNFLQQPERTLVFGGDVTINRVLGGLSDREGLLHPLFAIMPSGKEVNISVSLGWGKQVKETDAKQEIVLPKLQNAAEILVDSWNIVMRVPIPDELQLPSTVHIKQLSKKEIMFKGGDKELRARFWNYFIIGLDAQKWYDASSNSWLRHVALPLSIKIKDQDRWKKLDFHQSIKSIVCLNMPSFPGGLDPWGLPNQKRKREKNFTASFVDDKLIEVIGFKDSWHGENFLPLDIHGTRLAQVNRIQFELEKGAVEHVYMSFDGTKWKQPIPMDDDTYPIGITYSSATKMLATTASKCKLTPLASKDETI